MICVLGFYKRKPGLTHEEFLHHWKNVHAPLALSIPEVAKYIKKYTQHHLSPVSIFPGTQPLEFDGFSEMWVEKLEDYRALAEEPKFQEFMVPDDAKFLDTSATRIMMIDDPQVIKA